MIQIDMDIPKDCNGCPFAVTGNGEYFFCCFDVEKEVDMDSDYRRKDCPLKEVSQEPVLNKIREQMKDYLRGVEITLEVLVENDPLRPKMEGAKSTLEECLELIDKAESEAADE